MLHRSASCKRDPAGADLVAANAISKQRRTCAVLESGNEREPNFHVPSGATSASARVTTPISSPQSAPIHTCEPGRTSSLPPRAEKIAGTFSRPVLFAGCSAMASMVKVAALGPSSTMSCTRKGCEMRRELLRNQASSRKPASTLWLATKAMTSQPCGGVDGRHCRSNPASFHCPEPSILAGDGMICHIPEASRTATRTSAPYGKFCASPIKIHDWPASTSACVIRTDTRRPCGCSRPTSCAFARIGSKTTTTQGRSALITVRTRPVCKSSRTITLFALCRILTRKGVGVDMPLVHFL